MVDHAGGLFSGPVELMLAKAASALPGPAALPGGTAWEFKYDGYRCSVQAAPTGRVTLWSRNKTDLSDVFLDLVEAAEAEVPGGVVLDGEVVVVRPDGTLSFDALQQRMAARGGSRAVELARRRPASYVAFDVLAVAGADVRHLPWRDRRLLLEELGRGWQPPLMISPYTDDHATAVEWFAALPPTIEGLVAKGTRIGLSARGPRLAQSKAVRVTGSDRRRGNRTGHPAGGGRRRTSQRRRRPSDRGTKRPAGKSSGVAVGDGVGAGVVGSPSLAG